MANLKVTIKEDIELNGSQQGGVFAKTYTNITDIYKRIFTAPSNTEVSLYTTHASQTEGSVLDKDSIKYVRVTNLSTQYTSSVQITAADDGVAWVQIAPGASFMLSNHSEGIDTSTSADITQPNISWGHIMSMSAAGVSGSMQLELFAASITNG